MIDIPIVIVNTPAFARIEVPAPIDKLEYQILDNRKRPSLDLAEHLLDQRTFESVEAQVERAVSGM